MLLELRDIHKRFGGIAALTGGNLSAEGGEVHLLLGENGAGKSTLVKIAAGMYGFDSGEMIWRGRPARFRHPAEAAANGIAMVHQESLLAPHLSVAENIFLGREPVSAAGFVRRSRMMEAAGRLIAEHGFPLRPEWRAERLGPAGRQLVEICRAIQHGSSLVIFDEPTSSLSGPEAREVFRIVRSLRDRGMGVIYITHRLEELKAVGDRVTILRDGATVATGPLGDFDTGAIIRHMVGREVAGLFRREPLPPGETLLEVEDLHAPPLIAGVSLRLRAGEIAGLAGLVGAGRTELCRALFGLAPVSRGRIRVAGRELFRHGPREAVRAGLALIPEDRQRDGLAGLLPVAHNITLASLEAVSRRGGFLDAAAERAVAAALMSRFRIKAESPRQQAARLSGGNQQKAVIARWVMRQARVFLFDEPARGIDVGAKAEVFALMDSLARQGAALLMVSSEMPELLQTADRILVMRQGRLAGELGRGCTQEQILRLAALEEDAA